jgi:hypothetical protein
MRTIFDKSVQDERVSCQEGSFENTGITNHSADLVVVAQVQSSSYRTIDTAKPLRFSGLSLVSGL